MPWVDVTDEKAKEEILKGFRPQKSTKENLLATAGATAADILGGPGDLAYLGMLGVDKATKFLTGGRYGSYVPDMAPSQAIAEGLGMAGIDAKPDENFAAQWPIRFAGSSIWGVGGRATGLLNAGQAATPLAATAKAAMQEAGMGLASGTAYAGAKEVSDSPAVQMLAALSPNVAAQIATEIPRLALVGGYGDRASFLQRATEKKDVTGKIGTVAQNGGTTLSQFLERGFAPTPGGAVAAHQTGLAQQQAAGAKFAETFDVADTSPGALGKIIRTGDTEHLGKFRGTSNQLWNKVLGYFDSKKLPAGLPSVYKIDNIANEYDSLLSSVPERDIAEAGLSSQVKQIGEFVDKYRNTGMSVSGMRRMKELIADVMEPGLDYKPRQAGIADKLYGAMVSDVKDAANTLDSAMAAKGIRPKAGFPTASEALSDATNYHAHEMKRRALLPSNLKEMSDADIGNWVARERDPVTLSVIKRNIGKDRWDQVRGTVLGQMMEAPASKQTVDLKTSTESFLTNIQNAQKKGGEGWMRAMFGSKGSGYRDNVEKVIKHFSDFRSSSQMLINPSGSGAAGITGATLGAAAMAGMTGNIPLAATIMGYMGGTYGALKTFMNSEGLIRWLAKVPEYPTYALPGHIARLSKVPVKNEEERKARDELLKALQGAAP